MRPVEYVPTIRLIRCVMHIFVDIDIFMMSFVISLYVILILLLYFDTLGYCNTVIISVLLPVTDRLGLIVLTSLLVLVYPSPSIYVCVCKVVEQIYHFISLILVLLNTFFLLILHSIFVLMDLIRVSFRFPSKLFHGI